MKAFNVLSSVAVVLCLVACSSADEQEDVGQAPGSRGEACEAAALAVVAANSACGGFDLGEGYTNDFVLSCCGDRCKESVEVAEGCVQAIESGECSDLFPLNTGRLVLPAQCDGLLI